MRIFFGEPPQEGIAYQFLGDYILKYGKEPGPAMGFFEAYDLNERFDFLRGQVEHMANTTHQAYHQDQPGSWRECPRPLCADAKITIEKSNQ